MHACASSRVSERPRGVVHDHRARLGRRRQRVAHRRRARRAALHPARAQPVRGRGHDDPVAHGLEHVQAPRDQRPAGTNDERLGPVGAKAFATAAGGNDPDDGHGYRFYAPAAAPLRLRVRVHDQLLEMRLRLLLLHVERVHQLGGEDLLRAGVHLLLTRREALLLLADREVANHLGELEDVTGLDLLAVVLETPVPVLRHLAHVVAEDTEDLLDVVLPDHAPQTRLVGVAARDHDRHVVMKDLDGEVLALLAEHLLHLLLEDLARPMMGVDDLVADLVDGRLAVDLEVLYVELLLHHCVANGSLLRVRAASSIAACWFQVCR